MNIIETVQKVTDGKLIIDIPKDFEGKELKVVITEMATSVDADDWSTLKGEERLKILKQFAGTAKYPDTPISKYDVYDQ